MNKIFYNIFNNNCIYFQFLIMFFFTNHNYTFNNFIYLFLPLFFISIILTTDYYLKDFVLGASKHLQKANKEFSLSINKKDAFYQRENAKDRLFTEIYKILLFLFLFIFAAILLFDLTINYVFENSYPNSILFKILSLISAFLFLANFFIKNFFFTNNYKKINFFDACFNLLFISILLYFYINYQISQLYFFYIFFLLEFIKNLFYLLLLKKKIFSYFFDKSKLGSDLRVLFFVKKFIINIFVQNLFLLNLYLILIHFYLKGNLIINFFLISILLYFYNFFFSKKINFLPIVTILQLYKKYKLTLIFYAFKALIIIGACLLLFSIFFYKFQDYHSLNKEIFFYFNLFILILIPLSLIKPTLSICYFFNLENKVFKASVFSIIINFLLFLLVKIFKFENILIFVPAFSCSLFLIILLFIVQKKFKNSFFYN